MNILHYGYFFVKCGKNVYVDKPSFSGIKYIDSYGGAMVSTGMLKPKERVVARTTIKP